MLDYVEIRSEAERELIGIIDTAKSIIWSPSYYGAGYVEVYAPCTSGAVDLLKEGNYITRPDDPNVGKIEGVEITYNAQDGRMIIAHGRFAKSILDRRIIYSISGNSVSPTILSGNVEAAARSLVTKNAISCPFDFGRNIAELELGASAGTTERIVDSAGYAAYKQVTFDDLLAYSDGLLGEYGLGARIELSALRKLQYRVYKGIDRSVDNSDGNEPVIFSQNFDNLITSDYSYAVDVYKNSALIGGEGQGTERFCTTLTDAATTGLSRRESFVDAASSSKTYRDENDVEQTLTDAEYEQQLKTQGRQRLAELSIIEMFSGTIDVSRSMVKYGVANDFYIGDITTIQDNDIGLYINARILTVTETKDDFGYKVEVEFGL